MSHKIEVELFTFEELNSEAQEKVLSDFYDINVDYNWWEYSYEYIQEVGEKLGFNFSEPEFYFDLDRGSHFSFNGSLTALDFINNYRSFVKAYPEIKDFQDNHDIIKVYSRMIRRDVGEVYTTSSRKRTDYSLNIWSEVKEQTETNFETVGDELEEIVNNFRNWAIQILQTEQDYQTSEESIKESIIANEYTFLADGTQF